MDLYRLQNYSHKLLVPDGKLDEKGIPRADRLPSWKSGGPLSTESDASGNPLPVYHPTMVIQYGLAQADRVINGEEDAREPLLACTRWLEEQACWDPERRFKQWEIAVRVRTPARSTPWISGMAQGQGISLLIRSHEVFARQESADTIEAAIRSFLYPVSAGGVTSMLPGRGLFIEEYAYSPCIHVLNGALDGLYAIYEYCQLNDDPEIKSLLEQSVEGALACIDDFDTGRWSLYSTGLRMNSANWHYHKVHIGQLRALGELLGLDHFLEVANRWQEYQDSEKHRRRHRHTKQLELIGIRSLTLSGFESLKYNDLMTMG